MTSTPTQHPLQLTLGIELKNEATFDNFYPGNNQEVVDILKAVASGLQTRFVYLCGDRAQGISHLLQACCHYAQGFGLYSAFLPLNLLIHHSADMLNGFERYDLVCVDDLHLIAGSAEWEEAFFHLYNKLQDNQAALVVSAQNLPKKINIKLSDLCSRLTSGIIYQLHSLQDHEKVAALMQRANYRGFNLSQEVAQYILNHCPRHMGTLLAALDALDKASLAAKRRLTIPFVKEILQI